MRTIKTTGSASTDLRTYFTIKLLDGTPAFGENGKQPVYSLNGGVPNSTGITVLTRIGATNRYYADLLPSFIGTLLPGDILVTNFSDSGITLDAEGDTFQIVNAATLSAQPTLPAAAYGSYVGVAEADVYFSQRLNRKRWLLSSPSDKLISLKQATQLIDRLNFGGDKADDTQLLQFPRSYTVTTPVIVTTLADISLNPFVTSTTKDDNVPVDIKIACCEVAYKLLDGVDVDMEIEVLATDSQGYSSVKQVYNRKFTQEHILAGIPSALAWSHLYPYLRDPRTVSLSRGS